jgi:two-component system, OmpR family, sensor histidine kinase MprB
MSLRWRIALSLAAVAGAVGMLAAAGAYVATANQISSTVDRDLLARGQELSGIRDAKGRQTDLNHVEPNRPGEPPHLDGCPAAGQFQVGATQLVLTDGTKKPCVANGPVLPFEPSDGGTKTHLRTFSTGGDSYRLMTTPWHEGGYIQIARPLTEGHDVLERLAVRLLALTLGGIALAAILGWFLANRVVRPITRLRDTAETIATTQDLTTPIPVDGVGEVASLARSFTTMVSALAGSREQQKRLISDASHEMRTPLTSLRTNVELLEHFERLGETDRAAVLSAVQVDSAELTHLLSELVELATDQTTSTEVAEPLRLADVAADVVGRARRRSGRVIEINAVDHVGLVIARPSMMERAISNLVENAVKYSPAGTPIDVNIDGGRLEVRDHGPGIAEADQPLVFERFYRATLTRTEPGSGLGLAIVKQIVDRHAGQVWARNHPDGGALVGFSLPI